ncbi:cytidine deaminase [Puia dinghuensis]|uniref:Cytidine deaminase n=1 Tax=Puia dinghuensis TaxID=1792502 RepID=A0A8J2U718_9BACT|nr:cytidine deaminase [Puia dinghuensis]GGA82983.1 cytidine deaminase [Puia dinghuensis]
MKKEFTLSYEEYASAQELSEADAALLAKAREVTKDAYAPYSHFRVGAAARLVNGEVITGTNQENAAFPAGICAERTLLSVAATLYPGVSIDTLAISYHNENGISDRPISPCGICRQSLQEFEQRTGRPMRVVLGGETGKVIVLAGSGLLLPFAFTSDELK